jgi:hypothetical protein
MSYRNPKVEGAVHELMRVWKVWSCAGPQRNGTPFFVKSLRGAAMVLKYLMKHQ